MIQRAETHVAPSRPTSQVNALCLNSESTLLATCGNDRKVTTWNLPHCSKAKELSLDGWVRTRAARTRAQERQPRRRRQSSSPPPLPPPSYLPFSSAALAL